MPDDEELLGRIHKLHDIYQVLAPGGGELHLPTAWKSVRNFEDGTREFVSTLLQALTVWIAPRNTIGEEDFIRRLVRQMMNAEKQQHQKTVRQFLGRMEHRDQAKNKLQWELQAQNVAEAQKECTFQPKIHCSEKSKLPPTTWPGVSDLQTMYPLSDPDYQRPPAEPPEPPDPASWVARLYRPAGQDTRPQWLPDAGVNALRGVEGGMQHPLTGKELQPVTGQRLEAAALTNWVAGLRTDEPRAHGQGGAYRNAWEERSVSSRGSAATEDVDVTPGGRRKKIYGSGSQGSVDSYRDGFKPPKGSNVNNMGTAVAVPVYKWKDRLRGGYLSSKLDMSAIALATRARLHEIPPRSFDEYRGPPSEYQPPHPYDEYTAVPAPATRHGIMHGVQ